MPRKSSIHFKPVSNVRFAVSHSERTDLSEPAYLLPKEYQLDNIVVAGSLSENDLSALFIQQKEGMTGQAKARGSSPFWEGVVVLPNTNGQEQSTNLQAWKKEYEKATGHKVLHMSVHLDEGYLDALGKPQYNPHAHVIVTRMDSKNRVINLDRKQLAQVQDLTASTLQMERGSTLAERQGKRGRKHVPHREFRAQADEKRLELDKEKGKTARIQKLYQDDTPIISGLKAEVAKQAAEISQLKAQYQLDKEALETKYKADRDEYKSSTEKKTQQDYKDLKEAHLGEIDSLVKAHAEQLEGLKTKLAEAQQQAGKVPDLVEQVKTLKPQADKVQGLEQDLTKAQTKAKEVPGLEATVISQADQIAQLKEQYKLGREAMKASGDAKQSDYQALKKAHEAAIAALKESTQKVEKMEKKIADQDAELVDVKAKFAAMATQYQAEKAKGTPAHLITPAPSSIKSAVLAPAPRPPEAIKTAQEPPKQPEVPTPSPAPTKSLVEPEKTPRDLIFEILKFAKKTILAVIDVLDFGMSAEEAARKHQTFGHTVRRAVLDYTQYVEQHPTPEPKPEPESKPPGGDGTPVRTPGKDSWSR